MEWELNEACARRTPKIFTHVYTLLTFVIFSIVVCPSRLYDEIHFSDASKEIGKSGSTFLATYTYDGLHFLARSVGSYCFHFSSRDVATLWRGEVEARGPT